MISLNDTEIWTSILNTNPLPWLLEDDTPAVKHMTLRLLLDRTEDDPEVRSSLAAAMRTDPIVSILAAQHPDGYWVKPGPGYAPKYTGTVWQVIFLDQLGADRNDERVRAACEYVLSHTQTESGGLGASGSHIDSVPPPPSSVIHCLNGNLLRALIGFGYLRDERVQRAIEWQARSITGEGFESTSSYYRYYRSGTSGPGFCCAANEGLPCAWGAVKVLLALARIPDESRPPHVTRAINQAASFLLSRDPAVADYQMGWGNTRPNGSWFKLGFPSGYVADMLQNLQALCEAGYAGDPQLRSVIGWVLSKQDALGRWKNQYAYNGKTWVDFERQGEPSKWVTLRACYVISSVLATQHRVWQQ
jgi:hypothetical protein